jgi:hypothetical protein
VWTWKERGTRVVVQAKGVPDAEVQRSIASLRAASPDDWADLRRQAAPR